MRCGTVQTQEVKTRRRDSIPKHATMNDRDFSRRVPQQAQSPGLFGFEGKSTVEGCPLSDLPDLRDQVPDLKPYLLPFQRVIFVGEVFEAPPPNQRRRSHPSSSLALMSLMSAARLRDIGVNGPGPAAEPLREHEGVEQFRLLRALFGRDSLHLGIQLYEDFPRLLRSTIHQLAGLQGVGYNSASEEEPGRIIHWAPEPNDPIALHITKVNDWQWPHYGAVDSTPLFVMAVLRVAQDDIEFLDERYSGRDLEQHTIRHALESATAWLVKRLDENPEGLLEFIMKQPRGIWNQAWKDTPESYMHANGTYANHRKGIASVEVQSLAHKTLLALARFHRREAEGRGRMNLQREDSLSRASSFQARADHLRSTVLDVFWIDDDRGGYFALATDRDESGRLRRLEVRTSNMGHAINLLEGDDHEIKRRRQALIMTLFSEELLDRNGIRTLSNREVRFAPRSYHCGSVWPWDTRAIAEELYHAGYPGLAHDLDARLWQVVESLGFFIELVPGNNAVKPSEMLIHRLVDVYDGERDHFSDSYRIEKPAQETQAWTVEAIRAIKKTYQPLRPDPCLSIHAQEPSKRQFELLVLEGSGSPIT